MNGLSVIIPSKDAANLKACVAAVRRHEPSVRIIVVDDGLDMTRLEPSAPHGCWLCEMDPILRIEGLQPFCFARNVNAGIRRAWRDDIVLLNDDALLETPGGFQKLQAAVEEHPGYGVAAAVTNLSGNPRQQQHIGHGLREEPKSLCFICVLIPRRTIEQAGYLDERFTAYGAEDADYCHRVKQAGLKLGIFDGCFVDHGSLRSTFRGDPRAQSPALEAGRAIFAGKWGAAAAQELWPC